MRFLWQVLNVFRKGTRNQRLLAGGGIALILGALLYALVQLVWEVVILVAVFLAGVFLLRRAARPSPPSS